MSPSDIDKASFALGELTGRLSSIENTQKAMFEKLDKIETAITYLKVKNAAQAATIAIIISIVMALFNPFKGDG